MSEEDKQKEQLYMTQWFILPEYIEVKSRGSLQLF